jgi:hypothetical protein
MNPRDAAVDFLVYTSPFGARTSFYNLVSPTTFVRFVIDYVYAAGRLHLAPLLTPGIKEFAMEVFLVLSIWPALRRVRYQESSPINRSAAFLACLVLAHVGVSILFEPDLGSYMRHLSSVALFSMALMSGELPVRRSGSSVRHRVTSDVDTSTVSLSGFVS